MESLLLEIRATPKSMEEVFRNLALRLIRKGVTYSSFIRNIRPLCQHMPDDFLDALAEEIRAQETRA